MTSKETKHALCKKIPARIDLNFSFWLFAVWVGTSIKPGIGWHKPSQLHKKLKIKTINFKNRKCLTHQNLWLYKRKTGKKYWPVRFMLFKNAESCRELKTAQVFVLNWVSSFDEKKKKEASGVIVEPTLVLRPWQVCICSHGKTYLSKMQTVFVKSCRELQRVQVFVLDWVCPDEKGVRGDNVELALV